jgi:hypothetical protein
MDLPFIGGALMWSNNRDFPSWSKIDRFLVFLDLEDKFLNLFQKRMHNHFAIILDCCGIHEGKKSFKFENMWLKVESL